MSSFQDLYEHAAADRGRAMQFLAIQEIRRKAVNEMTSAGVYQEPDDENMTDDDRANRRAEAAYVYGLHSILEVSKMPDQDGDEAYAMAVRDTSTKAYCLALCLQTKMEELRANGSEKKSANGTPRFTVVVSNDGPEETTDPLREGQAGFVVFRAADDRQRVHKHADTAPDPGFIPAVINRGQDSVFPVQEFRESESHGGDPERDRNVCRWSGPHYG